MKREILFRGQRVDIKEWVEGDLIHGVCPKYGKMYILPIKTLYPTGCNNLDGWEVIPESVGQFTGLTDKNGVKIFEGDIFPGNFLVEFLPGGCFGVRHKKDHAINTIRQCQSRGNCIVIGNLTDSPDLLK